jgi:hypothetical protein
MIEIIIHTAGGGAWIVQDHQDGTAGLRYRQGDDGAGRPITDIRAELTKRSVPLDAWPT